jgi:hypothetical protein
VSSFNQNPIQPIQIVQPVQVVASASMPLASGAATNVPANTPTTLVTYTPSADKIITRIAVSGTAYGKVELFTNASLIETQRMGPERNVNIQFANPLLLISGTPLDVKITHYVTGELNNFEATIYGV